MKLVASMIVRNEIGRYLVPCVEHLLEFCDEVCVLDDGSEDGTADWLSARDGVSLTWGLQHSFFAHEGQARQRLLNYTLACEPTHVLSIDADELVTDGQALRAFCEADEGNGAWTLAMEEAWKADERHLWLRQDGGWRPHQVPILWRVPDVLDASYRIQNRALACGREPEAVRKLWRGSTPTHVSLLHLGWTCEADRQARYDRYVEADGGKYHASAHLRSIMLPDRRVRLKRREWPAALEPWKARILERANLAVAA